MSKIGDDFAFARLAIRAGLAPEHAFIASQLRRALMAGPIEDESTTAFAIAQSQAIAKIMTAALAEMDKFPDNHVMQSLPDALGGA